VLPVTHTRALLQKCAPESGSVIVSFTGRNLSEGVTLQVGGKIVDFNGVLSLASPESSPASLV
jgi:hypothetical protein